MYSKNFTTNDYAKQAVYGLQFAEDAIAGGSAVRLPAISKHGCVRPHGTGEFGEVKSAKLDRKAVKFPTLAKREMARQAARAGMFGL